MITKTKLTSMHSKCPLKKSIMIGYLTVLQIQNKIYSMTLSVKHPIFQYCKNSESVQFDLTKLPYKGFDLTKFDVRIIYYDYRKSKQSG